MSHRPAWNFNQHNRRVRFCLALLGIPLLFGLDLVRKRLLVKAA